MLNRIKGLCCALLNATNAAVKPDIITYTATRPEVVAGDIAGVEKTVESILSGRPAEVRRYFQSLYFHIIDYNDDPRELYNISECRKWFQQIDRRYPFLIYFIPCNQYTLYVGSQRDLNGSQLHLLQLSAFLAVRSEPLRELGDRIDEPYEAMMAKIGRSLKTHINGNP